MPPTKNDIYHFERPGIHFKNGKYYRFWDDGVVVLRGWPSPCAWQKKTHGGWRQICEEADNILSARSFFAPLTPVTEPPRPFILADGQMLLPRITQEEREAWGAYASESARYQFVSSIPEEIRQELTRYSTRRWHLLSLFARCPGALDLSKSNPALLFALASNWIFHTPKVANPLRSARALLYRKQRVIQAWLGFPATERVRRLLAKITPDTLSVERLLYLRTALTEPSCLKLLSHLPRIRRGVLLLATHPLFRDRITPCALRDILALEEHPSEGENHSNDIQQLVRDIRNMVTLLGENRMVPWPNAFHSLDQVRGYHDQLAERVNSCCPLNGTELPEYFPEPPYPGTESIHAIKTMTELIQEGVEQHNCVTSRVYRILSGKEYIYRVTSPVRGTLALQYKSRQWSFLEFKLACNLPADPTIPYNLVLELCKRVS